MNSHQRRKARRQWSAEFMQKYIAHMDARGRERRMPLLTPSPEKQREFQDLVRLLKHCRGDVDHHGRIIMRTCFSPTRSPTRTGAVIVEPRK